MFKSKFKIFWSTLCFLIAAMSFTPAYSTNLSCNVKLEFDSNSKGSVASYILSLQLKNTTGRSISGASIIYMDVNKKQLGNTLLRCSSNADKLSEPVNPGSYGQCVSVLQQVDGAFMNAFGSEKWTEIVNTQLASLNAVATCKVLGFAY